MESPFCFTKQLFREKTSRMLSGRSTYSEANRNVPVEVMTGSFRPGTPEVALESAVT